MSFFKKIFILAIFLFSLGEIIRIDYGNGIVFRPLDVVIGMTVVFWLIFKLIKKEKIKQKNIYIPILSFAGIGGLSLLINYSSLSVSEFFISLMYLIRWIAYAGIFFVVLDFDENFKKKISNILIIVGSLIVGLGYIQYFFYSNLRNLYYLGWDEHMYRMFSVFLDPNFAGAFFVLFLLFLVSIFLKKKSILMGLILILTLAAVFLTFSRSALIMLIISTSLLFILMSRKKLIILLFAIVFVAILISSRYFNIANINLFRVASSEARIETAKDTLRIIQSRPILGIGFNAYRYVQVQYGLRNKINNASHADASTDNSFLFVMATTGIVGLILYLFLWFRMIKNASVLVIASVVGVFVDSLFINSLFYPFIMLWLWILMGLEIKRNN